MSTSKTHRLLGTISLATLAVLLGGNAPPAPTRVAGTYFVTEQATGTQEFLTIYADGNVLLNSSAEDEFHFGSSQGVWERNGPRSIVVKVANFDFDDDGIAVVDFVLEFDPTFEELTGEFEGALYPDDVDPLDPGDALPIFTFSDVVLGRRMVSAR